MTISNDDIRALSAEAANAGDWLQVALCDFVLGRNLSDEQIETLAAADWDVLQDRHAARAECERVIAEAASQA